jgi:calcium-translocating P-type ATPase
MTGGEPGDHWHSLPAREVVVRLGSDDRDGLKAAEAQIRLDRHGPNRLPQPKPPSSWLRFFRQFHNILIYVLLLSAFGAVLMSDWPDAAVILGVVFINAVIGFVQEGKAEDALAAIRKMLSLTANVIRDGVRLAVPAEDLVPGDLVFLQSGDKVPADLRILEGKRLQVEEAALTGESVGVEKSPAAVDAQAVLGDRSCMAYCGTLVAYGQALGLVVATGADTELGRISNLLNRVSALDTPLQRHLESFGRWLTFAILAMSAACFAFGYLIRGHDLHEMFMAMVGIAVAAIPEGLPAVVTITLAVGVQRMARRNAIVRQLPAVESLGSVTVICSDKAGTLTRNEMVVSEIVTETACYRAEDLPGWTEAYPGDESLGGLLSAIVLCNDAVLLEKAGAYKTEGDPTEAALLMLGAQLGIRAGDLSETCPRLDSIPFESEHRFMASLHRLSSGGGRLYLKGAPEAVIGRCSPSDDEDAAAFVRRWQGQADRLAGQGSRVLAVAGKPMPPEVERIGFADAEEGLTLLGLCALMDPPRDEAIAAVRQCQEAGIRVKMITGDHALTARAIASRMGLAAAPAAVLQGAEIEAMGDEDLRSRVLEVDVFARASPEHKLRLVNALQAEGQIVAMTGDGVNDAPALKRSDVGVAMGMKGTEAAKDAAVMVLADDNFATIAHAVEEGRTIYDNLRKALIYILPTSFGQAGAIMAGIFLGLTLPITPLQILWVNMITAVTLSLTLAFEPPEDAVMRRPPRNPREPLLSWFFVWRIGFVSALLVVGLLGLFLYEQHMGASLAQARTAAVNALVVGEIFYLFNSRFIHASALGLRSVTGNPYVPLAVVLMVLLQAVFSYAPPVQALFGTASISLDAWGRILAFGFALFLMVEVEKALVRTLRRRAGSSEGRAQKTERESVAKKLDLTRYAWLSIAAAVLTIGLKAAAYFLTGSVGLLSDALESLVNLVGAIMALWMLIVAARPPDDDHHFGHGKAEYFSSGLEGALILVAAIAIGVSAFHRIMEPQPLQSLNLGLSISLLAALINLAVARILLRVGKRYRSITLEADAQHLMTDVWTSVGVVAGLGAVAVTGWTILDPLIACAVAVNIVWAGFQLIRRSIAGLLDVTLPAAENARIDAILDQYRGRGIVFHDLRTRQSGVQRFMTVHVLVPGQVTVQAGHDMVETLESEIRDQIGQISITSHLEPLEDPASFVHE